MKFSLSSSFARLTLFVLVAVFLLRSADAW